MSIEVAHEIGLLGFLLLIGALFSEAFKRMGQSTLLGELLVGVVLGPSVLGVLQLSPSMDVLMELGLLLLLVETGLETQWRNLWKLGPQAIMVAMLGVILPWASGLGFGLFNGLSMMMSVMVGATLTATSIGITARTLSDLKLMNCRESQIILGAAVLDDIIGLAVLGIMQSLALLKHEGNHSVQIIALAMACGLLTILLGRFFWKRFPDLGRRLLHFVRHLLALLGRRFFVLVDGTSKEQMIIIGSILLTAWAVQTYIGISMALVAFACGLLLKERENNPEFKLVLRDVAAFSSVITPLFFVGIGMQLNLGLFNPFIPGQLKILGLALILTLLAVVTKGVVGFVLRDQSLNRAVIGMGMIPRGEVGLIFVQVGKSSGLLDETWSNLLIVVVILTTVLAPFLLKFFLKRFPVAALS
ncbi:MAG: hypothetical protein HEQ32_06395 [Vampirovibrio sp.]